MNLKLFLLGLIFFSCNIDNNKVTQYRPERLSQDKNIEVLSFQVIDTLFIEENENVILTDITSLSISQDGSTMAVTNPSSKQLVLFNDKGDIIGEFKSGVFLSDSVALSGKEASRQWWDERMLKHNWKYITIAQLKDHGMEPENAKMVCNNMILIARFLENRLYANTIVYIPSVNGTGDNWRNWDNRSVILEFEKNFSNYSCLIAQYPDNTWPMGTGDFYVGNQLILTTMGYVDQDKKNQKDTMVTLCTYNRKNGDVVESIGWLPDCYEKSNLAYSLWWEPILHMNNDELYIAYPLEDKIYGKYNNVRFELKNLPYSNRRGFELIEDYRDLTKKWFKDNEGKELQTRCLHNMFPTRILKILGDDKNLFVFILVKVPDEKIYLLVQKYDYNGKLIAQGKIPYDNDNVIHQFDYDEKNQMFVFMKKSKRGWTAERMEL